MNFPTNRKNEAQSPADPSPCSLLPVGNYVKQYEGSQVARGIGILKNSTDFLPVPEARRRASRTEIDAGNAISSGSGARLSSDAPFPYVPISPAPTCAFVLIRSGRIRGEILRGRRMLSSRKCAGNPIILGPRRAGLRAESQPGSSILIRPTERVPNENTGRINRVRYWTELRKHSRGLRYAWRTPKKRYSMHETRQIERRTHSGAKR